MKKQIYRKLPEFEIENKVLKKYNGSGGNVVIPDGVIAIGYKAFYDCKGLTGVTITDSVTSIGYQAFSYCTGLTSVAIPDSVHKIGEWAFSDCTNLKTVYYTGSQEKWDAIQIGSNNSPLINAKIYFNMR